MEELHYGSGSKEKKETGDFQSKKLGNGGYNHKITDWNKFTEFAKKHSGKNYIMGVAAKKKKKQEIFSQKNLEMEVIITKLPTGINLLNLPKNMVEKFYRKWLSFGVMLVSQRFIEPLKKVDSHAKKDMWIQRKE